MKAIYAQRIKRLLENEYDIFPVGTIPNPKDRRYKAWIYNETPELSFALDQIMASKGDSMNGDS